MEENNIYLLNSTSISKIKRKVIDSMKKITALNMNWNEYSEVVDKATEGKAALIITDGEWDYVCENGYELEVKEINGMIGELLDVKVTDVVIDISNDADCVVIICA